MSISKRDFLALGAAAGASMALPAWAQGKPLFDTLNMFVPAAPGGGWDGTARVTWPDQELKLPLIQSTVSAEVSTYSVSPSYLLVFRKATGDHFCLESVSHPIDAFHLPNQPGLQLLQKGESLTLAVSWRFDGGAALNTETDLILFPASGQSARSTLP